MAAKALNVKIEGLDELIKAFEKLGPDAMNLLKAAADDAGENLVLPRARENVAKFRKYSQAGTLYRSLRVNKIILKNGEMTTNCIVTWGDDVRDYAAPLELGHKINRGGKKIGKADPHPFLRPAADKSKKEVKAKIAAAMNKALENMGGEK